MISTRVKLNTAICVLLSNRGRAWFLTLTRARNMMRDGKISAKESGAYDNSPSRPSDRERAQNSSLVRSFIKMTIPEIPRPRARAFKTTTWSRILNYAHSPSWEESIRHGLTS